MPPKGKGASSKAKNADATATATSTPAPAPKPEEPLTVYQRALQAYELTNPLESKREKVGLHGLTPAERQAYIDAQYTAPGAADTLSKKAAKDLWKRVNDASPPLHRLPKPTPHQWGKDKYGRNIGDYTEEQYIERHIKGARLIHLLAESRYFKQCRFRAQRKFKNVVTGDSCKLEDGAVEAERARRKEMAALKEELYGKRMGPYATDPDWDDVVPIPQMEPEGALASIAYPEDYAESMSYLRAVMAVNEHTPRCLKLTEHIISMNPAHYTVWLYRFSIIQSLDIPILDELSWLNEVSLDHQKNYQIWHHRQLLLDHYVPTIEGSPDQLKRLAKSERDFMTEMFSEDAKNYHVWSYRQYVVRKLSAWDDADELFSIGFMVEQDVRNNSAWSHRFFFVFSNPAYTTPGSHATEEDPRVPGDIIDREMRYAQDKIKMAPQNQSPWNYLRGVLVKGDRPFAYVREFAESYATDLGGHKEEVLSSHALDLLADLYKQEGDKESADLCLQRLGQKWDPIRKGYWEWKRKALYA